MPPYSHLGDGSRPCVKKKMFMSHHGFILVMFTEAIKYFLNFSVIISKMANIDRYNSYKQKFSMVLSKYKGVLRPRSLRTTNLAHLSLYLYI